MLTVKKNGILLASDVLKYLGEKYGPEADFSRESITYRVTGLSFQDILDMGADSDSEYVNEFMVDDRISDGFLFGDISFEAVGFDKEGIIVEVTVNDIFDWITSMIELDEDYNHNCFELDKRF